MIKEYPKVSQFPNLETIVLIFGVYMSICSPTHQFTNTLSSKSFLVTC